MDSNHLVQRKVSCWGGLLGSVLLLGLTGCIHAPEEQTEALEVAVPAQWDEAATGTDFTPQTWMEDFGDSQLELILAEALEHNFSLMAAAARRDAAVAGTEVGRADLWPTLGLSGSYNESSRQVADDGSTSLDINTTTYGLSGRFAWEIDLWGRLRNGYRADLADAEAALAEFEATRLSIAARTASAWYAVLEAQKLLELSQQTLVAFRENERTVEEGFERGIGGALEVRLIRANVASAESAVEATQRNLDDTRRALELLLGRYPAAEMAGASDWPEFAAEVPGGLPAELLLRRPDLIVAERNLAAAQERSYEASKAMLPNLSLSLSGGTNAAELGDLTNLDAAQVWSQVWTLSQPLFQGGRLRAQADRGEALARQAVANYTQTVLVAFGEVEDALGEQASFERDYAANQRAAAESIEAGQLAWERYEAGLADITTALDADRRSINAQQALIRVTHQRVQSRINLYLALGGGFVPAVAETAATP